MSENEILDVFDRLGLGREDQREAVLFTSFESGPEVAIEVVEVNNASTQTGNPLLLHA